MNCVRVNLHFSSHLQFSLYTDGEIYFHQYALTLPVPIAPDWFGNINHRINESPDNHDSIIFIPNDKYLVGVSWTSPDQPIEVWKETNQTFDQLFHITYGIHNFSVCPSYCPVLCFCYRFTRQSYLTCMYVTPKSDAYSNIIGTIGLI